MISLVLPLLLKLNSFSCPATCWDVLHKDLVAFGDESRAEMELCMMRWNRHFSHREGDSFRFSCWEAKHIVTSRAAAKERAEEVQMTVAEIRMVAQDRLDQDYCKYTNAERLRHAFAEEQSRQEAIYECMNAEDLINYPWAMGVRGAEPKDGRDPPLDLCCWQGGWRAFYKARSNP